MKKSLIIILSLSLIGAFWWSCSQQHLSPASFLQQIEDPTQGMRAATEVNGYQVELQYMPPAALVLLEKGPEAINDPQWESWVTERSQSDYFRFKVQPTETGAQRLNVADLQNEMGSTYFSFEAQRDFWVESGQDSLACLLYHHEPNYGMSQDYTFVLAFPKADRQEMLSFHYADKVLGIGQLSLRMDPSRWEELLID